MIKLAGNTTRGVRPIQWDIVPGASPTPHGFILNARVHSELSMDLTPPIELGGDPVAPWFRPNVNIVPGVLVDTVCDLNNPFPFKTGEYGFVFSKFVIEHIKNSRIKQFISECYRITKPGGANVHICPNLRAQCAAMVSRDRWEHHDINMIFGGDETPDKPDPHEGYHHTGFSPGLAVDMFKEAGFSEVVVWEYPVFRLEMVIEAWK